VRRTKVKKTLVEDVHAQLRSDILTGRLSPGSRLKMAETATELQVSLSVLREALAHLAEQNLVVLEPQAGYRVLSLSRDDLLDLTAARVQIETAALREAIRRGDVAWEAQLIASHHAMVRTPRDVADDPERPNEAWIQAHGAFHANMLAGCGSRRLLGIVASLREVADVYRLWSLPVGRDRDRDIHGEHRAILEAALARDEEQAVALYTRHVERTTETLLRRFDAGSAAGAVAGGQEAGQAFD
jgi:DNA-binding GntR family transcriptional regulator